MENQVKSGKEILDDFFKEIESIENVDKGIAQSLATLYQQDKLTDANVKNELQKLRERNGN
ncbi:flagellin-specific chaperone FliS [Mucilaginibacter sp. UYP25]|uniref:hypothetical protein n=1 Tax=unclassified Mucilaginibacter TaxID=2617802 RepID=UPI003397C14B